MPQLKKEEVRGFRFSNEIMCTACVETDVQCGVILMEDLTLDNILIEDKMPGEDYLFCDECGAIL